MKNKKIILTIALTAALILALSITVFAATITKAEGVPGSASITVLLPETPEGYTTNNVYKFFRVFGVQIDETEGAAVYTLLPGKTFAPDGFYVDHNGNVRCRSIPFLAVWDDYYIEDLSAAIRAYVEDDDLVATVTTTSEDSSFTVNDLPYGFYYITSTAGTAVMFATTNPIHCINECNGVPSFDQKIVGASDLGEDGKIQVGSIVEYEASILVESGAEGYEFHDKMDDSLAYNDDLLVKVDDTEVAAGHTTFNVGSVDGDTITVTFKDSYLCSLSRYPVITITYSATVTDDAPWFEPMCNTAYLSYGDENGENYTSAVTNEVYLGETIEGSSGGEEEIYTGRIDFNIISNGYVVPGYVDNIYFNPNWFSQDAKQYNHLLCQFCSQFSMLGYANRNQLINALKAIGFEVNDKDNSDTKDVDENFVNLSAGRDEVNYFIVSKEIHVNNEPKTLIFAGFIGSYHKQWNSNFDPYGMAREKSYAGNGEKGIVHLGFADAREFVYQRLQDYITEKGIERSSIKLLLTGHSRGAATANLLAGKLIRKDLMVDSGNLYAYTFATPRGAQVEGMLGEKYGCIFNIVNPEDFVTKVLPYNWGFYRFGYRNDRSTFVLPSKTNEAENYSAYKEAMQAYYAKLTHGKEYSPFIDGEKTVYKLVKRFTNKVRSLSGFYETKYYIDIIDSKYPLSSFSFFQHYICPFVNGTKEEDRPSASLMVNAAAFSDSPFSDLIRFFIFQETVGGMTYNLLLDSYFSESHDMRTYCAYVMSMKKSDMRYREGYEGTVNCPVDVEIIDKRTNEVVGRIVDNVVDEEIFAKENSVVVSVDGDEKTFWLPSNGDYEVKLIGNDSGKMDYTLAEIDSDIGELSRTSFFDVALDDGRTYTSEVGGETFTLPEYTLTTEDGTEIQPDETFDAENAIEYTVTVIVDENGTAESGGVYTSGDYATVNATPNEGCEFDGWYVNDELVSSDAAYRFRVDADVTLTAKFTLPPHVHKYTTVTTPATCTEPGETTYTCVDGDDAYTETIPALGHVDEGNDGHCDRCGTQMTGGDHCKFCGKIHNGGFFDKLTGFFHKIFAIFKR